MNVGIDRALFGYDSLMRLTVENVGIRSRNYVYRDLDGGKTTTQVAKLSYPTLKGRYNFEYSYDSMGNITGYEIVCDGNAAYGEAPFTYSYDNQNQLTGATDGTNTYAYAYDGAGNILTATKNGTTHSYTYGDNDWRDLLTAYDNQSIAYDGAGNPTSYYNGTRWNFTWGNGRRLETASNGTSNISYNYSADGIRTTKTVNGVVHTYYYSGGLLRRETYGDTTLDFLYDANGTPFSLLVNRSAWYYYITNLQGDVIRLVDYLGNTAAYYEYDPYGNATHASGSHATINPLRYRSYYYDTDTGMYYLQSRYYDPQIGRFINADSYASTGQGFLGCNMFAYCGNNPILNYDLSGNRHIEHADAAAGPRPYIVDQSANGVGEKPFGLATVEHSGCGAVASYNALLSMGDYKSFDKVLQGYYGQLVLGGYIGMVPYNIESYFVDLGYTVIVTSAEEQIESLSKNADACIMYYKYPHTYSITDSFGINAYGAHFIEYSQQGIGYIGRNTAENNGIHHFSSPWDYGNKNNRYGVVGVFIYK